MNRAMVEKCENKANGKDMASTPHGCGFLIAFFRRVNGIDHHPFRGIDGVEPSQKPVPFSWWHLFDVVHGRISCLVAFNPFTEVLAARKNDVIWKQSGWTIAHDLAVIEFIGGEITAPILLPRSAIELRRHGGFIGMHNQEIG